MSGRGRSSIRDDRGDAARAHARGRSPTTELRGNLRTAAAQLGAPGGSGCAARAPVRRDARARAGDPPRQHPPTCPSCSTRLEERVTRGRRHRVPRRRRRRGLPLRHRPGRGARGATLVAKSKSMATEEIKLNEALEEAGLRVVETDLGEWILQLAGQHPAHIVAPAVHLNKRAGRASCSRAESGEELPERPRGAGGPRAPAPARGLRRAPTSASRASTWRVAETGTLCVVENEGNARLVTALPRIHVAVMGMERVVADWDEAAPHPAAAADGRDRRRRRRPTSTSSPARARPDEADGPEELHLVILDGGRAALRGTEFEEALALHPLRRLPLLLPDVAERGRPGLRLALLRARSARSSPRCSRAWRGERSQRAAVPLVALRRVPRGLPGRDPAARPARARARPRSSTPAHRRARLRLPRSGAARGASPPLYRRQRRRRAGSACACWAAAGWVRRLPGPGAALDRRSATCPTRWPPRRLAPSVLVAALVRRRASGEEVAPAAAGGRRGRAAAGVGRGRGRCWPTTPWLDELGRARGARRGRAGVLRWPDGRGADWRELLGLDGAGRDLRRHRARPGRWPSGARWCSRPARATAARSTWSACYHLAVLPGGAHRARPWPRRWPRPTRRAAPAVGRLAGLGPEPHLGHREDLDPRRARRARRARADRGRRGGRPGALAAADRLHRAVGLALGVALGDRAPLVVEASCRARGPARSWRARSLK